MVKGKMNTKITNKNTIWNPWISQLDANRSSKKSWLIISAGNEIKLFDVAGQKVKFVFIFYGGWFYKGVLLLRVEGKMKGSVWCPILFTTYHCYTFIPEQIWNHVSSAFLDHDQY